MTHEPTPKRTALIIGCGIAGAVIAMFLQRAGITPLVYEGRPDPRDEAGYLLNLSANGLNVLDTLKIKDEVLGYGFPTTNIAFLNHRGKQIGTNPEPMLLIKRSLLTKALREAAIERGISIEFDKRLTDVEITRQRTVAAHFEDGSSAHGDVLVGSDGIHSRTRRSLMPTAPQPTYTGVISSAGFTHRSSVPPSDGVFRMTFGRKGFFGYQVVPSGEIYWFETFNQTTEPDRDQLEAIPNDEWQQKLLDIHRDDHDPVPEIIRSTESDIGRLPVYDLPSLSTWHTGPVCLLGDAAHAMSPHGGQGAAIAMEDAIVLGKCLRDVSDVETAFATYEARRTDRVEKLGKQAQRTDTWAVPSNRFTRWIRDLVLPLFLKRSGNNTEWIHSHSVDWNERVA